MINKDLVKKHFSSSAWSYDLHAHVQHKMAKELIEFCQLREKENVKSILEIGCGTGYVTEILRDLFPFADISALDIAPGMVEVARQRLKGKNVRFICVDAEDFDYDAGYDLVLSNATFQWFNRLSETLTKIIAGINNGGIVCFSTFGPKTFYELHQSYKKAKENLNIVSEVSPGQSFYSIKDIKNILQNIYRSSRLGFNLSEKVESHYFETVREFFSSIQKTGATNSNQECMSRNPSLIKEAVKIYEAKFSKNNKIRVTYHCIYGVLVISN